MFQYGYTNFQKKGYRFASENEFFHASLKNRNAKLAQLVNHVDTKHTAYLEAEPTAYLGIFTDLDSNQENQRYYFQRSGRILERNAGYAQGYVQDVAKENDEAFFREPFLQLLWVPFRTGQELVQLPSEDCDRYFPDVTVDAFHLEQNPIKLEQGLLLRILEELLKGDRLVLHIDQQGDQAPQYSLGVLRHIYECLPYAMRRNCGFATNVAPERFSTNIDADRLPGAVQLCLVDGDVELPGRVSGFTVLEMGETYPVADENREFLQMLTVDSDTRRNFFEMVQENYGFHHASMEEYRTMYQLAMHLALPINVQAVEIWADDYRTLPRIRENIGKCVAEKLTVSMAEQALWSVPLPELEKVADLARSEKMTAAWELRMFNGIYANDEQTLQRLAETVTERYRVLCREQAGALRRGYEFATEESKEKLWQTAQLPLENDLKLPAKYKDNKIVEALGQMLPPAIQKLADKEKASYETRLQAEQHEATELVQRCVDLGQLVRFCRYLCESQKYSLCHDAFVAGGRFGAQNSYGPECLCTIAKRVKEYPLPIHLDAMEKSTAEVEALEESVLYREKMVGFEEPVVQAAAKEKKELVNAYKQLCGVLQTGNVQDWMHTMAELAQGASKWKSLPEEMHDEAFSVLRKALMAKEVKAEDLFACTGELQKIETRDPALLQKLLQAAGLLDIDIENQQQVTLLLSYGSQWASLCRNMNCRTKFSPADQRWGRPDIVYRIQPESMLEFLRWHYGRTRNAVPKLVLKLTQDAPDWLMKKYGTDAKRTVEILQSLSPCNAENRFVQELMTNPMPSAEVGSMLISALKKSGRTEEELHRACHPSWGGMIFAEYYDPTQGEQGEVIQDLRKRLVLVQQQGEQLCQKRAEADRKKQENRSKRLEKQSNAMGWKLAIFFVFYGLLPLLGLWISKLLLAETVKIWLVAELVTVVLLAVIGCVLMPIGMEENGRYIRRAATMGCIGLLPGILLAAILMVLL